MRELTTLTYEEHGPLATVTLNRPGQGNRINIAMIQDLAAVCDHLEDASEARVVVFRGANGVFSEGIDFGDFDPGKLIDIHGFNKWEKIVVRLERLPKVTVALVDGPALGGGFQLALVMDQRLASPRATFHLPEVHLGFLPGMATFRLAKYVGLGHAKRILLCAPVLGPEEALRLGILDRVSEDLDQALAETIASFGPIHTVAVQLARRLLNESFCTQFEDALGNFLAAQHRSVTQTAFLDTLKRARETR
ncbi:MAG: enoyl-CoA hydratase/isomerase family protein [Deltaproteobacteria bacterium]|nr:enoyl-CoA hydratase/isomerase family protein [Deltaproteobacteria bacterium]